MTAMSPPSEKHQTQTRQLLILSKLFSSGMFALISSGMFTLMCIICFVFLLNVPIIIVSLTVYANGGILFMNTGQILFH